MARVDQGRVAIIQGRVGGRAAIGQGKHSTQGFGWEVFIEADPRTVGEGTGAAELPRRRRIYSKAAEGQVLAVIGGQVERRFRRGLKSYTGKYTLL
jgi:hypothetical protein